ncbi:multiheme c-type cytochrome [Candidatus Reidiella endopervernicosa]|uniref:multiheme c-type cytochrome n=1 Tax=Candidatus Reidiella endopervernicosa TaxID=2738883 RepID=UPI0023518497|nr:multiheme c-type cytochrome [Candidatus Reidiella endopervernicosa]
MPTPDVWWLSQSNSMISLLMSVVTVSQATHWRWSGAGCQHFVDKPKAEVTACVQCHSVATKCDSCHTRHLYSAAEARRPEACITCHSGPPHPDDETFASAHGQLYLAEGRSGLE